MRLQIEATDQDDAAFIAVVEKILNGAIQCYRPHQIYLIQIDTWFDHKWKGYSGRKGYCCNVWLDPMTPPPFVPNRVKSQRVLRRSECEPFTFDLAKAPALHIAGSTDFSSHRRLKNMTSAGVYMWYSSRTVKDDRASIMVYSVQGRQNLGWYVSFLKREQWRFGLGYGISPEELSLLMQAETQPDQAE